MDWFPTGVATDPSIKQYFFNTEEKAFLYTLAPNAPNEFFQSLENAITTFLLFNNIQKNTLKPKAAKMSVEKIQKACRSLAAELQALDCSTRLLIQFQLKELNELSLQLYKLEKQCDVAFNELSTNNKPGKPKDFALHQLACDIARAIENNLGCKASLTHYINDAGNNGLYAEVLEFCIEICTGTPPNDMFEIMKKGKNLMSKTVEEHGLITTKHFDDLT